MEFGSIVGKHSWHKTACGVFDREMLTDTIHGKDYAIKTTTGTNNSHLS